MRRILAAVVVVCVVGMLGCSNVQKGTAAGGIVGSGVGAAVGHTLGTIGSGPGALAGLAIGATGGAIAGELMYGSEETGEDIQVASEELDELAKQLQAKDAQLAQARAALEREKAQQKALLEAYEKNRSAAGATSTKSLQASMPADVQVTEEEDRITFTILSAVLFDSGKADLKSKGKQTLAQAANAIRSQYADCMIEVRGHTDNVPIRYSGYKSNWELSMARAASVVAYLTGSHEFSPAQFATTGCADTEPVASNSTEAGRGKNRRAEIVVWPNKKFRLASARASE